VAERISQTERTAEDAERESVKLKKIEFFAIAAGRRDKFTAVILDVRNYGLVIELPEFLISGLVHVSALSDDFYLFDAARLRFVGRKNGRIFAAGERIEVAVAKVDMYKQQIDFQPVPEEKRNGGPQKQPREKDAKKGRKPSGKKRGDKRR